MSAPRPPRAGRRGYILLPVALALGLIASVALLASRDSGANVAMVANRADTEKARFAAEAGLQHANYAIQQAGCSGTYPQATVGPLTNAAFAGASYTAWADRAAGSPVQLTATGRYNGASVTLTRANVVVYQPTMQTYTVQPDSFTGKDTHVSPLLPTTNFGGEAVLRLASAAYQPLLQFGFSILPPGSRPVPWYDAGAGALAPGAQLSLWQTQTSGGAWSAGTQLVNRSWVAGKGPGLGATGATWNSSDGSTAWPAPGQGYEAMPVAALANTNTLGWQHWDVTDTAAAWLSGAVPNQGLWLVDSGTGGVDVRYSSSDEPINLAQRPKLTLNYLLPCGTLAPRRVTLSPVLDTEIDRAKPNADLGVRTQTAVQGALLNQQSRTLAQFDLSAIPSGSTVGSAALRVFVSGVTPLATTTTMPIEVHAMVTQVWSEQASWNERTANSGTGSKAWTPDLGGTFLPGIAAQTTVAAGYSGGTWIEFNVSALVQDWVSGNLPNLGLVLLATPGNDRLLLNSREALSNTPQLVVTYR